MKKFVSGLIVGLLLTTTVFASSEQIQAVFSDFNFKVNGQVQKVETKPLVYKGTSYLPVRELATLLDYDVDYDTNTRTIELSSKTEIETDIIKENTPVSNEEEIDMDEYISILNLDEYEIIWASVDVRNEKFGGMTPVIKLINKTNKKEATFDPVKIKRGTDGKLAFLKSELIELGLINQ